MLELAILGLLLESPMHGYELRKRLTGLLGAFRAFSYGSLYPALRRMQVDGLGTGAALNGGGVSTYVADISKTNELSNIQQVTKLGKASFAPYMQPDDKHILFASNVDDPKGRGFDIYRVTIDPKSNAVVGGGDRASLERITTNESFDGFPMFSPDGKKLVFASNRADAVAGETNVFIADWIE